MLEYRCVKVLIAYEMHEIKTEMFRHDLNHNMSDHLMLSPIAAPLKKHNV